MDSKRASLVLFAEDFISYVLNSQGLPWVPTTRDIPQFLNKFRPEFATAALYFAKFHKFEFDETLARFEDPVFADRESFFKYVDEFANRIFKGNVILMEFITFCAFAADLATIARRNMKYQFVQYLIEAIVLVFEQKVGPYFSIIGGWRALYSVAIQYTIFMRPSPQKRKIDETDEDIENSTTEYGEPKKL